MSCIILDGRHVLAYEALKSIGACADREKNWLEVLWSELVEDSALMKEFMYYVDHRSFLDEYQCQGYTLTDLYFFQMNRYNLIRDIGKNEESCSKEFLVLGAFHDMFQMTKDPKKYVKKLSESPGMDR